MAALFLVLCTTVHGSTTAPAEAAKLAVYRETPAPWPRTRRSFSIAEKKWTKIAYTVEPEGTKAPASMAWRVTYSAKHDVLMVLPGNKTAWVYDFKSNVLRELTDQMPGRYETTGCEWDPVNEVFWTIQGGGYGVGPVVTCAL